ncbi:MAG: L-fucokinase [Candidatus Fimenecus sp.]
MDSMVSLFLSQSYADAWDDYIRSLNRPNFIGWDYIILTASNEQQATGFEAQLRMRADRELLPQQTHFAVVPDPGGKRVGSGGATLNVLRYIAQMRDSADFSGLRILVIHSGGDSKRVPQYSALGKLFSPVPHTLPNGRASTLFDEMLIAVSGVPARIHAGMLVLSGDVLLLFNPLQIDFSGEGAAAISFKEYVETGKNHGVYTIGEDGNVAAFLHKQSVETLQSKGAVNAQDCVDIDTGAVLFSTDMLQALYSLISENGTKSDKKFCAFVNDRTRLSLYGDFLYPLATESDLDLFYLEKPEGEFCPELKAARKAVWSVLRGYKLRLLRLSPAKFIHFGTTQEIMRLLSAEIENYEHLHWSPTVNSSIMHQNVAAYNSVLSAQASCGENTYLEVSYVHAEGKVGRNSVLSYVDIHDETVPDDVVLHGLKQKDGRFVARMYGIADNPKNGLANGGTLFGVPLTDFLARTGLQQSDIWSDEDCTLWKAKLYPVCKNMQQAIAASLDLYSFVHGTGDGDVRQWLQSERKSLCEGFQDADNAALMAWDHRMQDLVQMNRFEESISAGDTVTQITENFPQQMLTSIQKEWLQRHIAQADFSRQLRLYYYIGHTLGGAVGEELIDCCFQQISRSILEATQNTLPVTPEYNIQKASCTVELPLRVNWGGGWSDTPPYCLENGGTVLNAAILLDGKRPVCVSLERLTARKIVFDSCDLNRHQEYESLIGLQNCSDPFDPFALPKAALLACGVIPKTGGDLQKILEKLGGGFCMRTEVHGVPKGSGLGTSSILAGACVKALLEFFGVAYTQDELYARVLCMEQLMSTGGGWQDQVGGLSDGIKYITSQPGVYQKLNVSHLCLSAETMSELNARFALIYSGQRRLARNLLRDVVGRYIGNVPETVSALSEIQRLTALMRFELERGNIDAFAQLLNRHWALSKQLDQGSSNTCIDHIFHSLEDLIDGRMISGAGGGGFLQVILKKGVSREALQHRLKTVFQDSGVAVWPCQFV